jgi:hypothetical protein
MPGYGYIVPIGTFWGTMNYEWMIDEFLAEKCAKIMKSSKFSVFSKKMQKIIFLWNFSERNYVYIFRELIPS